MTGLLSPKRKPSRSRTTGTLFSPQGRIRRKLRLETLEPRSLLTTLTWVGDVDANWNSGTSGVNTNWSGDVLPGTGDTLIFTGAAAGMLVNNTTAGNAYALQFTAAGYTLTGNGIALTTAVVNEVDDSAGNSINVPLTLNASSTFNISAGTTTLGNVLSGGAGAVSKTGVATLALTGTNTYGGATAISGGILQVGNGGATGNLGTGAVSIAAGATLAVNRTGAVSITNALNLVDSSNFSVVGGNVTITATPAFAANQSVRFNVNAGQNLTLATGNIGGAANKEIVFDGAGTGTFSGSFASGTAQGRFVKNGTGTWTLTGGNNNTGATAINGGTLQIGVGGATGQLGSGDVTIAAAATLAINRAGAFTFANNLTLNNYSSLSVLGGNVIHTGSITSSDNQTIRFNVDAGQTLELNTGNIGGGIGRVINLDGAGDGIFAKSFASGGADGTITKNGTGTWTISNTANNWATGGLVINNGTIALGAADVLPNGTGKGDITVNSPGILDLTNGGDTINGLAGNGTVVNTGATNRTLIVGGAGVSSTFAGVLQETGTGGLLLQKNGAGTITLTGANTYTGATTINAGTLTVSGSLSNSTDVTVAVGATYNLAANDTIDGLSGAGNVTLGTNTLTVGGNNEATPAFSGVLSGTGGFTKLGTGTQILSGTNTYTGATLISAGTLQLGAGGATGSLATASAITIAAGSVLAVNRSGTATITNGLALTNNSTFSVLGGTITVDGGITFGNNQTIRFNVEAGQNLILTGGNINGGNGRVINLDGAGTGTLDRRFSQGEANGTVIKNGTGTWIFSANYPAANAGWSTGGLTINNGVVRVDVNNGIPNGKTGNVAKGNVTINSPGVLDVNSDNVNINGLLGNGTVRNSGAVDRTLNVGYGDALGTFTGVLEQTGVGLLLLNKRGTGTQILTGASTFTGDTTVIDGVLQLGNGGATGALSGAITIRPDATLAVNRSGPLNCSICPGTFAVHRPGN